MKEIQMTEQVENGKGKKMVRSSMNEIDRKSSSATEMKNYDEWKIELTCIKRILWEIRHSKE